MLAFSLFVAVKIYRLSTTKYPPSFWVNSMVTMLILVGPAVEDSANGKDPYTAFAVRMSLFVAVTIYSILAIWLLEYLRSRKTLATPQFKPQESLL